MQTVLEQGGGQFAGVNRKVQIKPLTWSTPSAEGEGTEEKPRCTEALLILKHGGVLTHAGRAQASARLLQRYTACLRHILLPALLMMLTLHAPAEGSVQAGRSCERIKQAGRCLGRQPS